MGTHNLCFEQKYEKYQSFLSENFQFLEVKFSIYLNRRVFVMLGPCDPKSVAVTTQPCGNFLIRICGCAGCSESAHFISAQRHRDYFQVRF